MKQRIQDLIAEYGPVALGVYLCTFVVSMVAFSVAISMGFEVEGAAGGAGVLGAAWVGTKLIQPLRILLTLAVTPVVARVLRREPKLDQPG